MAGLWVYVIRRILFMIPGLPGGLHRDIPAHQRGRQPLDLIRLSFHNLSPRSSPLSTRSTISTSLSTRATSSGSGNFVTGNLGYSPVIRERQHRDLLLGRHDTRAAVLRSGAEPGHRDSGRVYSAKHQYSKGDYTVTTAAIFGVSLPTFWLGELFIIVFSLYLGWLPLSRRLLRLPAVLVGVPGARRLGARHSAHRGPDHSLGRGDSQAREGEHAGGAEAGLHPRRQGLRNL